MASSISIPQPRASSGQAIAGNESPRDRGQVPPATDNQPRSMDRDYYGFVERPSQDFFSPITLELLLEPQQLSCCGNHLSREAATRLQREGKRCPMCNEKEWNVVLDNYQVREVRIRCPHKGSGCDWVGGVSGLKRHADLCTKRPWECKYCGLKCTYGEGEGEHWPTCHKFPEPCPNGCEVGSVERCNVEQHRSVCSLELVACEMKEFGCSAVVRRKELAIHMRESELQHLTAMAVLNLRLSRQLQRESAERDRKITRLQRDVAELQTEMKTKMDEQMQMQTEMKAKIDKQKREVVALKIQVQAVQHTAQHIEEHTAGGACSVCKVFTFTNYVRHICSGSNAYSDIFYSHHHGYKCKLNIRYYSSYNDIGAFLHLATGEYDDQLHWPVELKVRLELLNQAGNHHHLERTKSYRWKKNERDKWCTIDTHLMEYPDLERKGGGVQYMMNDSLKFRVHLTALPA